MTTPLTWLDDWAAIESAAEAVPLDPDLLDLSHFPAPDRWAYRLQQLAVQGFSRWLREREPSLTLSVLDSPTAAAALLQAGPFRVCLIPISLGDDEAAIPQAVVKRPDSAAHFYVSVAIDEEANVASLEGFLTYDQLVACCAGRTPDADHTYPVPAAALNPDSNALLLSLHCLSPDAIALPTAPSPPSLIRPSLVEAVRQPLVNARLWLRRQAEALLPDDSWRPIPAMAMRWDPSSIRDQFNQVLQRSALPTPPDAAGVVYQPLTMAGCALRLFAAVWPAPDDDGDWMLLVMLCPAPEEAFPPGLSLAIDEITPERPCVELARETLEAEDPRSALFALVKGEPHDVFDVVITAADSESSWAAAIQFQPEA